MYIYIYVYTQLVSSDIKWMIFYQHRLALICFQPQHNGQNLWTQ